MVVVIVSFNYETRLCVVNELLYCTFLHVTAQ